MHADAKGTIEIQIKDWIYQHVVLKEKHRGLCRKLVLRHLSVDRKPQGDVCAISVPADEGLAGEIDMLTNKIVDAAQRDANDLHGVQQYALYAYYPDDPAYVPRKFIRVAADDDLEIERDVSPSEPPTEKGLVSQLMRHVEAIQKTATVSQSYIYQTMQRENARLAEMNEKFSGQQTDLMILVQDTMNEAHERRISEKKAEMSLALQEGAFEHLKTVIPIIVNRIAGRQLVPEPNRQFMLIASLLESLTPEQQAWFRDKFSPGQLATTAEILGEYEKEKALFTGERKVSSEFKSNALPSDPSVEQGKLSAVADGGPKPLKMFEKLGDRLASDPDSLSPDEKLRDFELQAKRFADRFKDRLKPSEPKPTT